jgi:hypothetical protein
VSAVIDLRYMAHVQPRMLVMMAKTLTPPPAAGVMCASKPHLPRLLGLEFLPLRRDWDMDSVRAQGADYLLLSPKEMVERPQFNQYRKQGGLPPYAHVIHYWRDWETVLLRLDPPADATPLAPDSGVGG